MMPAVSDLLPKHSSASITGVAIAIGVRLFPPRPRPGRELTCSQGNLLISLALNVQKLAHQRHADARASAAHGDSSRADEADDQRNEARGGDVFASTETPKPNERTALLVVSPALTKAGSWANGRKAKVLPVRIARGDSDGSSSKGSTRESHKDGDEGEADDEESRPYLKSKLWWLGLLLLVAGEGGNFTSYGFAPASVVAPLGSFALIANCFIAPGLLKERFRWRDLQGIALCILGAAIVVVSSKADDVQVRQPAPLARVYFQQRTALPGRIAAGDRPPRIHRICEHQPRRDSVRLLLGCLAVPLIPSSGLAYLSTKPIGDRYILVDLGVCALTGQLVLLLSLMMSVQLCSAGGFTVLSAKALASFLQLMFLDTCARAILLAGVRLSGV
jgi:drug/metabolite transporter (DMT)-like permease